MAVFNRRSTTSTRRRKQYSTTFALFVCITLFLLSGVLLLKELYYALRAQPETRPQLPAGPHTGTSTPSTVVGVVVVDLLAPLLLEKDGGFCAATSCPAGRNAPRLAWTQAPDAPDSVESNPLNRWAKVYVSGASSSSTPFPMLTRDRTTDKIISGTIQSGGQFDAAVRNCIIRQVVNKTAPVVIDIGANIGYMSSTALALGATVISFEPFLGNAGIFMSTVRTNGWQNRSHLYMNAVSYESVRVSMKPTNERVNLSNMFITASQCTDDPSLANNNNKTTTTSRGRSLDGTYGIHYMEAVSLDQVMLTHHPDISEVDVIKIDVERHEMHVINGAMKFLCNRVVKMIIMEVEYLKPHNNPEGTTPCDFATMQDRMERMGFSLWDVSFQREYTGKQLQSFPCDVVFLQNHQEQPPARRLQGTANNPCESFEL